MIDAADVSKKWRRIFIRRGIVMVIALVVTAVGLVQHDGLLIGFVDRVRRQT